MEMKLIKVKQHSYYVFCRHMWDLTRKEYWCWQQWEVPFMGEDPEDMKCKHWAQGLSDCITCIQNLSTWFKSQPLCFWSRFLLMPLLGGNWWRLKYSGPCHPSGDQLEFQAFSLGLVETWLLWAFVEWTSDPGRPGRFLCLSVFSLCNRVSRDNK